jgi:hypothetical protein
MWICGFILLLQPSAAAAAVKKMALQIAPAHPQEAPQAALAAALACP